MPDFASLRRNLDIRASVIAAIRSFFKKQGFLEVETPIRMRSPAPEAYIDAIASEDRYLSTSPELHMKQLLTAGYKRIFQVAKCFRWGERGRLHNPEFTMLEWYRAGGDYLDMLDDCMKLVQHVCAELRTGPGLHYQGLRLDMSPPWPRLTIAQAYQQYAGWTPGPNPDQNRFDLDMVEKIEPFIGRERPAVLMDYPAAMASLARTKAADRNVAERLEVYAGGLELANAFSELTDGQEQKRRFALENEKRRMQGKAIYPDPERFLSTVGQMPPSGGCALGVDRLVMLFCDAGSIDEVLTFTADDA
jgi:lysyl-tRNA synthetase class 2